MLDDYGFEIYEENAFPIAYLLTFRTFGTWLHGDERGAFQRSRDSRFKTITISPNVPLRGKMLSEIRQKPIVLSVRQRDIVKEAISEVCTHREYFPRAINVQSNHAHIVVSKNIKPNKIVNDFKAYATRRLRAAGEFPAKVKIWSRGASTRYLWKPRHVETAVDYVLYSQGDVPFETIFEKL